MKTTKSNAILVIGQLGVELFKAEVYPDQRVIICSSRLKNEPFRIADVGERASIIRRRLLISQCRFVNFKNYPFFKTWLYVEVFTSGNEFRFLKGTDLTGGDLPGHEDLTPEEAELIGPLIPKYLDGWKTREETLDEAKVEDAISA